jgi:hypothetical protein
VTAKGGARRASDYHATWETAIAGLLILGAIVLYETNYKQVREIYLFAIVLLVQALPFIAAAGLAAIERLPLNDYAYWREVEARLAEVLPNRLRAGKRAAPSVSPAPVAARNPAEPVA